MRITGPAEAQWKVPCMNFSPVVRCGGSELVVCLCRHSCVFSII